MPTKRSLLARAPLPLLAVLLLAVSSVAVADQHAHSSPPIDEAGIRQAVDDYVDALYESRPELLEKSVREKLVKEGYVPVADGEGYERSDMTRARLMEIAASGREIPADAPREIEIFDATDKIASVKLTAFWGIDYMFLVREERGWTISHVMLQRAPRGGD